MEKINLKQLFADKLFCIPDYQRGYAWDEKQINDFIEDVDSLAEDERVKFHYTGTVVTYRKKKNGEDIKTGYKRDEVYVEEVVDGQQRLTSICLYLSVIINRLIKLGQNYQSEVEEYLYDKAKRKSRIKPANNTAELFLQLLKDGTSPTSLERSVHGQRLIAAHEKFKTHIAKKGAKSLQKIYTAITGGLVFTYYTIGHKSEIGMTFELMNSRGKSLSQMELLKNYFMHWIFRNVEKKQEEQEGGLTKKVNATWAFVYENLVKIRGNSQDFENQCLRIAWTLFFNHSPKGWKGYDGFKEVIKLRPSNKEEQERAEKRLDQFVDFLSKVSKHYSAIMEPEENEVSGEELEWLKKIHRARNIANFLPVMVATRMQKIEHEIHNDDDYIDFLKAIECYSVRVFLMRGRRSDAGMTSLYKRGYQLWRNEHTLQEITGYLHGLMKRYYSDDDFDLDLDRPRDWYSSKRCLSYILFEYEKHLLKKKGKNQPPKLEFSDIKERSIEHILPQNVERKKYWKEMWKEEDRERYCHDIGNLVLTKNNPEYSNKDFPSKKGNPGEGICYSNSDLRQERELAQYEHWNKATLEERREQLVAWIKDRWKSKDVMVAQNVNEADDDDL